MYNLIFKLKINLIIVLSLAKTLENSNVVTSLLRLVYCQKKIQVKWGFFFISKFYFLEEF